MEQYHINFVNDEDVKRLYSRCFRGHNLHPKVTVLCTFSPRSDRSFSPSDKLSFFNFLYYSGR